MSMDDMPGTLIPPEMSNAPPAAVSCRACSPSACMFASMASSSSNSLVSLRHPSSSNQYLVRAASLGAKESLDT
eukprot:10824338-Alexandrium_andersonii.AAC.1